MSTSSFARDLQNLLEEETKTASDSKGQISRVSDEGLVSVQFEDVGDNQLVDFELDDLQFYVGTKFLSDFLFQWPWGNNKTYYFQLGASSCSYRSRSPLLHPRVLRIYEATPHGRVYINRQIQVEILRKISFNSATYFNELQTSVFIGATENGNMQFHIFLDFQDRVLRYPQSVKLPDAETRESLMELTEDELQHSVFVTTFSDTKNLQRVKITRLIYGKSELEVHFIDFGKDERITIDNNIFNANKIDINYARFPPLLVTCHLHGIVYMDVEASRETITGKRLQVQFAKALLDEPDDGDLIPQVNVYVNNSSKTFLLNEFLTQEGLAIPEVSEQQFEQEQQKRMSAKEQPLVSVTELNKMQLQKTPVAEGEAQGSGLSSDCGNSMKPVMLLRN